MPEYRQPEIMYQRLRKAKDKPQIANMKTEISMRGKHPSLVLSIALIASFTRHDLYSNHSSGGLTNPMVGAAPQGGRLFFVPSNGD
ncbi:hypothetical protein [Teichococcus aestuarii]|uniref:hypothetical protein n=1 Tax=Teichococcus aestuarii TaxID=568898 RepID=UPI0036172B2A